MLGSDSSLELGDVFALDIQIPLEVAAHLSLHLVDLLERKHLLRDDRPRLVRVRVVTDDFGCDHEGADEQSVARRSTGGGESGLQPLQEEKGGEGDDRGQACAVERVSDKVSQRGSRGTGRNRGRDVRALEERGDLRVRD